MWEAAAGATDELGMAPLLPQVGTNKVYQGRLANIEQVRAGGSPHVCGHGPGRSRNACGPGPPPSSSAAAAHSAWLRLLTPSLPPHTLAGPC
jgi:hypothetical protein